MPQRDAFSMLFDRVAELERRVTNTVRRVRVSAYEAGRVRVEDDTGFQSDWLSQAAITSGEWKIDAPANPGAQGMLFAPDGDPAQALFYPSLPSDDNPNASKEPGTFRLQGPQDITITITGGGVEITASTTVTVNAPETIVNSDTIQLGGEGGPAVARIGDLVAVGAGSSAGNWPIITGSDITFSN